MIQVCFVCLGNICRSPTAEGVLLHLLEQRQLRGVFHVDSAGTAAYHVGERPDPRSIAAAKRRGVDLPSVARRFEARDFEHFDYVLAMDANNHAELSALSRGRYGHKLFHLRDFDPDSPKGASVPDPYYGGEAGFEHVLDLCFAACAGLIDHALARRSAV